MNLFVTKKVRSASPAFTMIEIAIAIGIIAFALVAIIGILPRGLNVQKDNREDTIVNQDANLFMQAIRAGAVMTNDSRTGLAMPYAPSLDFLTNYVEGFAITNIIGGTVHERYYTNEAHAGDAYFPYGGGILGLLSTPYFVVPADSTVTNFSSPMTNYVRAYVRGISGSALEQNGANSVVAFRYIMDVQISPFMSFPSNVVFNANSPLPWSERSREAVYVSRNLWEVELTFHWPILANGQPGPNHQTYRSTVAGHLTYSALFSGGPAAESHYFAFQPQTFATNTMQ